MPKLNVAEYHRPYVAVWLEGADQKVAANLSVWYQQTSNSEGHGTKWLPTCASGGARVAVPCRCRWTA